MHYVGIDVAKATFEVSDAEGQRRRSCKNTAAGIGRFIAWLDRSFQGEVQLVIEPTGRYHHLLLDRLQAHGIPRTVINPARTKAYGVLAGKRAKTDRIDAQLLARMGGSERPEPSRDADPDQERLKSLRRHRDQLEEEMRATRNRLESASHSPWISPQVARSLRRTIAHLEGEIADASEKLDEAVEADEMLSTAAALLESVPGVARRTALLILSELPPAHTCRGPRSWVAFAGLCPEPRESGKAKWSRLSRVGSGRIRKQLYMAALAAMRWNPAVAAYVARLAERGKTGKLAVVAAMTKLVRICFGVLKNRRPFDPQLHLRYTTPAP